jgi:hypothetical protein
MQLNSYLRRVSRVSSMDLGEGIIDFMRAKSSYHTTSVQVVKDSVDLKLERQNLELLPSPLFVLHVK